MDNLSRVYARLDLNSNIIQIEGEQTLGNIKSTEEWVLVEEGKRCSRLDRAQVEYFPDGIWTNDFIPLYKWDGTNILPRTEEEIQADRDAIQLKLSIEELKRKANAPETKIAMLEEALCEFDLAISEWQSEIEDALCELDQSKEEMS